MRLFSRSAGPLASMVTPDMGAPEGSVTVPTRLAWASAGSGTHTIQTDIRNALMAPGGFAE
jgi:hypothetical protein